MIYILKLLTFLLDVLLYILKVLTLPIYLVYYNIACFISYINRK